MNLVLIRGGYPPIAVRPEDRPAYIGALHQAQAGGGTQSLKRLLYARLDATLEEYLSAARQAHLKPAAPAGSETEAPRAGSSKPREAAR